MSSRLPSFKPLQRAFWLALLLFGAIWQPTLMAASEVHETAHLFATGHAHDAQHPEAGIPGDEVVEADGMGWERLMHAGHCCGHPNAMLAVDLPVQAVLWHCPPPLRRECAATETEPSEVLRPPILA